MRLDILGWIYLVMTVVALVGAVGSYIEGDRMFPLVVFLIAVGAIGFWRFGFRSED